MWQNLEDGEWPHQRSMPEGWKRTKGVCISMIAGYLERFESFFSEIFRPQWGSEDIGIRAQAEGATLEFTTRVEASYNGKQRRKQFQLYTWKHT